MVIHALMVPSYPRRRPGNPTGNEMISLDPWRSPCMVKMVEEGHEAHAPDKCHLMKTLMPFKVLEAFSCWTLLMIWQTQLMTRAMTYNNLRVSNPWIWLSHEDHASVDKVHQGEALEALEDCLEFLFWWSPWFMENHGWNDQNIIH